jgi:hypothetical protein
MFNNLKTLGEANHRTEDGVKFNVRKRVQQPEM